MKSPKRPLPPEILARCRAMRRTPTDAESLIWQYLRDRRLGGHKFRRQVPIHGYILDFYCCESRLAVELDGGGHAEESQAAYDSERSAALAAEGITVLRFWNDEVLKEPLTVLGVIWDTLENSEGILNSPPSIPPLTVAEIAITVRKG